MRALVLIMAIVTGLLLFSTLICGFWIRAQEQIDPSSLSFHMWLAVLTALFTIVTLVIETVHIFRLSAA